MLANVLRTDLHAHRPLPADTELAQAIAVLARAPSRTPSRTSTGPATGSAPTCASITPPSWPPSPRSRAASPGPRPEPSWPPHPPPPTPRKLTLTQLRAALKKAGRSRGTDTEAARLREAFRTEQMRQLPLVEQAMGRQALALLRQLDAACAAADDLEHAATESFNQHPDAGIITSFPGLGALAAAGVSPRPETTDPGSPMLKGAKAYAGAAPITRASGKTRSVTRRRVKNNRLNAAGYIWAFSALTASPGARAHYDRRRDAGDRHAAAQRNLFSRLPRLPPPLPDHRQALRRSHRIPRCSQTISPSSLTT